MTTQHPVVVRSAFKFQHHTTTLLSVAVIGLRKKVSLRARFAGACTGVVLQFVSSKAGGNTAVCGWVSCCCGEDGWSVLSCLRSSL